MRVLFVCTGNICRSPFAEVAARQLADDGARQFSSAGTFAMDGNGATATGVEAAADLGFDLTGHEARRLTAALLAETDLVYGMEDEHVESVFALDRDVRAELLRPDGRSIPDPYGGDHDEYRACYSSIRTAVLTRFW